MTMQQRYIQAMVTWEKHQMTSKLLATARVVSWNAGMPCSSPLPPTPVHCLDARNMARANALLHAHLEIETTACGRGDNGMCECRSLPDLERLDI